MPTFPFEVSLETILQDPDSYIDATFSCLESKFLIMPKGPGFIEYTVFEKGYEALKAATGGFSIFNLDTILPAVASDPISIVVLRTMLGFTPSEWGHVTSQKTHVTISQNFAKTLDRNIRINPDTPLNTSGVKKERLMAMVKTACDMLEAGASDVDDSLLHRLEKADTKKGISGIKNLAGMGVPYAMLLYERFLGRPFAAHRDSVSELIGDSLETAIEDVLSDANISYRKTKRAERIEGFDQAPDFMIPSEYCPEVIIEAKITEDDGTARDKVTRIQHLGELSLAGRPEDDPKYEVIACIDGRGFSTRREDMKKMIVATRGKVFTAKTLDRLVKCTRLKEFQSR